MGDNGWVDGDLPALRRGERAILSVLSLLGGIGMSYVVKTLVWRSPVGPVWLKGLVIGAVGFGAYLVVDWWLFRSARANLGRFEGTAHVGSDSPGDEPK